MLASLKEAVVLEIARAVGVPRSVIYNERVPIEPQQERLYTVGEAAKRLGMTRQRIHQLIDDGRLKAEVHGKFKLIPESQLDTLQERIKPTGRPRKS